MNPIPSCCIALALTIPATPQITTSQYDNARTSATLSERYLTPHNVTANNSAVWNGPDTTPATLYAFDAIKLGVPLYTSEQNRQRDRAAMATRFAIPVVYSGHIYFGTRSEVEVYGLLK